MSKPQLSRFIPRELARDILKLPSQDAYVSINSPEGAYCKKPANTERTNAPSQIREQTDGSAAGN